MYSLIPTGVVRLFASIRKYSLNHLQHFFKLYFGDIVIIIKLVQETTIAKQLHKLRVRWWIVIEKVNLLDDYTVLTYLPQTYIFFCQFFGNFCKNFANLTTNTIVLLS